MLQSKKSTCEVATDGTKEWFLNGKRHREDGPAIEWANGGKEYYLHGKKVTEADLPINKN